MPIVPIQSVCRDEKQSFLTHLGISVSRSHLGQLQVHLSDPPEHTLSTSEPVAPLSEGNWNEEGYIFRGRKTLKADGYYRYQTTRGNAVCGFKWDNCSSNLLWACLTTYNPKRGANAPVYTIKHNTWKRGIEMPGAIPVARCTYHKSTFGPEHGPCKLKKWIVHRFPQPVSLSTPWGNSYVPQLPVDMTLVLYFQESGVENALIR